VGERGARSKQGRQHALDQCCKNTNANDIAGKPLGFGDVLFGQSEAPVVPLFPVEVAPQPVALAA